MAISPEQISKIGGKVCNLDEIEKEIDASMTQYHGWYPWEEAIIDHEFSVEARNEIAQRYIKAGWKYVYHNTSSEHGERPGLTSFKFSNSEIEHCEKNSNDYYKVTK